MRILIGYDGSTHSDEAIADLLYAGIPATGEATVLVIDDGVSESAAETEEVEGGNVLSAAPLSRTRMSVEALRLADQGRARLQRLFPGWLVRADVRAGIPAWGILARADAWRPDLIVVGSRGQSSERASDLGSVSTKVMAEARSSVRIGRHVSRPRAGARPCPVHAVVGVDGSGDARAAARIVADREWYGEVMVRVVGVFEHELLQELEPDSLDEARAADPAHAGQLRELEAAVRAATDGFLRRGVPAAPVVRYGDPADRLVSEALEWGAHQIFVGAKGHHFLERSFVGSVAQMTATGASCSVEVVRLV